MCPAELALAGHVLEVGGQAVARENPREGRAEDGLQHVRAAGGRKAIDHKQARDERPEPALVPIGAVARFIDVEDRFLAQGHGEFGVRRGDGWTRFFPGMLSAAQTDRNLQRTLEEPLHDQAGQPTDHRQVGNQRGELRPKLPDRIIGQRRVRHATALSTPSVMAAIFRDVRLDRRQLRHLMTPRMALFVAGMQHAATMATRVRGEIDDRVHALDRDKGAGVTWMARLATRLAAALPPTTTHTLVSGQSVRGGWFRRDRGVLVTQRQLPFEIGDLFLRVRNFLRRFRQSSLAFRQLMAKSLVLALQPFFGVRTVPSLLLRHALHGTPIDSICTDP